MKNQDDESGAEDSSEPVQPPIAIEIELDATLGYASIQNSVPVVRSLRLTNQGSDSLENLEVLVDCNQIGRAHV